MSTQRREDRLRSAGTMGRANKIGAEAVGLIRAQQPCAGYSVFDSAIFRSLDAERLFPEEKAALQDFEMAIRESKTLMRWNGPSRWGSVGHKLPAIGLPHHKACSACSLERLERHATPWASRSTAAVRSVFIRSSFPPIAFPTGFAHLQPTSPHVPRALSSRAERYDGKRDLHLQHAA
jgi:hypothetical protein